MVVGGAGGEDHPRIRGEHRGEPGQDDSHGGSSPHTRGAPFTSIALTSRRRIIPAYAGSTVEFGFLFAQIGDHPRIRGEH